MSPTPLSVAPHRYTFLVYRQPPNYTPPVDVHYAPGVRNNFDLNAYVAKAGLQGPVGGNYYLEGLAQVSELLTESSGVMLILIIAGRLPRHARMHSERRGI